MKRIAIFVEGQTEQIFIHRLVREILGENKVSIVMKRSRGGATIPKQEIVKGASFSRNPDYYVLINDCGADNRVKSEIMENLENLSEKGYKYIIGVRDLYPLHEKDYPRLEKGMNFLPKHYKTYRNALKIIIIIQEVETWFLAETHHLKKVDKRLNGSFINKYLGFNPFSMDVTQRRHPSRDLNDIYRLVGKSYTKRHWQVEKLVNKLDFDNVIRNLKYDIPSLGQLVDALENARKK